MPFIPQRIRKKKLVRTINISMNLDRLFDGKEVCENGDTQRGRKSLRMLFIVR